MQRTCTGSWHIELYLTPSNLVYSTAGVLCALAVGIAIIIGLLQAREKVTRSRESLFFALKVMERERGRGRDFHREVEGGKRERKKARGRGRELEGEGEREREREAER